MRKVTFVVAGSAAPVCIAGPPTREIPCMKSIRVFSHRHLAHRYPLTGTTARALHPYQLHACRAVGTPVRHYVEVEWPLIPVLTVMQDEEPVKTPEAYMLG